MQHFLGGKGKDVVVLITSLIHAIVEEVLLGARYKRSKETRSK